MDHAAPGRLWVRLMKRHRVERDATVGDVTYHVEGDGESATVFRADGSYFTDLWYAGKELTDELVHEAIEKRLAR